jgi:hypothetical protein
VTWALWRSRKREIHDHSHRDPAHDHRSLFFGDDDDSVFELVNGSQARIDALAGALRENSALSSVAAAATTLSRAGLGAVGHEIAAMAHGLLDLDLADVVVAGWCKLADLTAAAKRTLATPGSAEIVELATHCITWTHNPQVAVLVNGTRVATVRFDMSIKLTIKALVAAVHHGRLVRLDSGGCDVTGTLAAEGKQLAKRQAHFQLPLLLRLGNGIPLLRTAVRPAAAIAADAD